MNLRKIISEFVTQICEKNYSQADKTLDTVLTEKMKKRIKNAKEKTQNCGCEECNSKPDYIDLDKDRNTKESMKKAAADKKKKTKKVSKKVTKKG